jgi:uncharacterized protein (TIGR02217 family)
MTFHEVTIPETISYGVSGGVGFKTDIIENFAGFEQRNISWSQIKGRWTISYNTRNKSDLAILNAFFIARRGKAYGFRFKDWSDYQAINASIGIGNGTATTFQLIKIYSDTASSYVRSIKKPVSGTVKIYLNGTLQSSGYSVNYTTGIITFITAPSSGVVITADFEFDVPVRFDTDQANISISLPNSGGGWVEIPIVEIRV